eukprot:Rmarinus@m.14342
MVWKGFARRFMLIRLTLRCLFLPGNSMHVRCASSHVKSSLEEWQIWKCLMQLNSPSLSTLGKKISMIWMSSSRFIGLPSSTGWSRIRKGLRFPWRRPISSSCCARDISMRRSFSSFLRRKSSVV